MLASSMAEWISTGAGIFSAVGTVGALLVAVGLLRHEQAARRAQEERQMRAQANLVSTWWAGSARFDPNEGETERGAQVSFSIGAFVHNGSDAPVYDTLVEMPGAEKYGNEFEPADLEILRPQSTVRVSMLWRCPPEEHDSIFGIPSVSFTDTHGQRWRRDHGGAIARDECTVAPRWERIKAESRRSDAWFALWDENPFVKFENFDDARVNESSQ